MGEAGGDSLAGTDVEKCDELNCEGVGVGVGISDGGVGGDDGDGDAVSL